MKASVILVVLIISVLLTGVLAGCSKAIKENNASSADVSKSDSDIKVTPSQTEKQEPKKSTQKTDVEPSEKELVFDDTNFTLNGIGIGSTKATIIETLGNPNTIEPYQSVDANGKTIDSKGEQLIYGTYQKGSIFDLSKGKLIILMITDNSIKTTKGFKIGDSTDKVKALYGSSVKDKGLGMNHHQMIWGNAVKSKGYMYFMYATAYDDPAKNKEIGRYGIVDNEKEPVW